MEEKNNNLENFLRKKLAETGEAGDGWDRPDAEVWEQAQAQIPAFGKHKKPQKKLLFLLVLLLLLLGAGVYMLSLQKEIKDLKNELYDEKGQVADAIQKRLKSEKKYDSEKSEWQIENRKLQISNSLSFKQKTKLESTLQAHQKSIAQLQKDNQLLQKRLEDQLSKAKAGNRKPEDKKDIPKKKEFLKTEAIVNQNIPLLSQKQMLIESPEFQILNNSNPLLPDIPAKKEGQKFEIGFEYSLATNKIPSIYDFKDLSSTSKNSTSNSFTSHSQGIHLGFYLKRNLLIKTGFRWASFKTHQDFKTGLIYDKSKEYIKPNGETGNDLEFKLNTPYSEERSSIGVDIPQDADLETGDLLVLDMNETQNIQLYQIPLGVQYFISDKKLKWYLEGGIQWNKMAFRDYQLSTEVYADNEVLPIDKIEYFSKPSSSKQFMAAYGGIGLNYQFFKHWNVRAAYVFNYNFINNKSKAFSNSELSASAFNLGLNYKF